MENAIKKTKRVVLDVLGGDYGAEATIAGALWALKDDLTLNLVLVGDENVIRPRVTKYADRVEILHTTTNIGMDEKPTVAIRQKTDSSIVLGMNALREREECVAFVSAGSTGAVLTGAIMCLGRIEGVSRPALTPALPTMDGRGFIICDVGANMDSKPQNIQQFAIMADIYLREQGVKNPRIGLLNVGTEDEKGNELVKESHKLLCESRDKHGMNYLGGVESWTALAGGYDAVITDGFSGNIFLKTLEGTCKFMANELKIAIKGPSVLLGKLILGNRLIKMKKKIADATNIPAIFLGIKKPVLKVHGSSSAETIRNALLHATRTGDMNLAEKISSAVKNQ